MIFFHAQFSVLFIAVICQTVLTECPVGWVNGFGMCYNSMVRDIYIPVTWGYANAQCKRSDVRGRLPVFKDATSWRAFSLTWKQMKSQLLMYYPSSNSHAYEIFPIGAYKLKDEWYWVDGSKMSNGAINWEKGQPNGTIDQPKNCVGFNSIDGDTGYSDIPCNSLNSHLCQADPNETPGVLNNSHSQDAYMSSPSESCPAGWDTLGDLCYKEPSSTPTIATPSDGAVACAKLNPKAKLPEFYTFQDYDKFIKAMSLKEKADHENIALGFRQKAGRYVNSDGQSYYLNWDVNEPSGLECVFTNDMNGYMWLATNCSQKGYIYCQLDTRSVQPRPTMAPTTRKVAQPYPYGQPYPYSQPYPYGQPDPYGVNGYPYGNPSMVNYPTQPKADSSEAALISSLSTFNKLLSQSNSAEEDFGRSVANQLKNFNTILKSDAMYEIQKVLSSKTKENW